jgi:osmoprotectant transport system permease protein
MLTHGPEIFQKTLEHVSLSLSAVLLACLVGIPVGFLIVGHKKLSQVVLGIANIIQTIPSLAMFAFAIPMFGIGVKPAVFALFLYALLPILKNTLLGIRNVDPSIIKAAKGMGMSRFQIMFMVEVPLSISIIMGGIRIATVTSIGVTTIATLIAAGGLGDFIYQGLSTFNQPMILTGAVLSAGLALLADFGLGLVEKKLTSEGLKAETSKGHKKKNTKHTKRNIIIVVLVLVTMLSIIFKSNFKKKDTITIVNKNYTEQRIMGQMVGQYLESIGYETEVKELGGTMLCFNALLSGDIDIYNEYTGTMYSSILKQTEILSADETYQICKDLSEEQYGVTWLEPYGFNNTYALSATKEFVDKYGLESISDLEPIASSVLIGGGSEFGAREIDGFPAVEKKYGFEFKDYKTMDVGISYQAVVKGEIDISAAYGTDGRIAKYKLVTLEDDKNVFPPYYLTPIMRQDFAKEHPDVVKALTNLKDKFTSDDMRHYNLMVDEGADVKDVATIMLKDKNLI